MFTNRKNCDIINTPNELNKRSDRYIFLYGIIIPFLCIPLNVIHLVKMRLPFDGVYTYLRISSFGDNLEFAFFGAPTSVGALFVFSKQK